MWTVASSFAKRAVDGFGGGEQDPEVINVEIGPWGTAVIAISFLIYCVGMFKIRYILGEVVSTLAIVEQPESQAIVGLEPAYKDVDSKETDKLIVEEVIMVKTKPVTSKFRTAIAHLKANGGRQSRFRGIGVYLVSYICRTLATVLLVTMLPGMMAFVADIVAEVLVANLNLAWIHVVLSKTSNKRWSSRVKSSNWTKIAPAALFKGVAHQLTVTLPALAICSYKPAKDLMANPGAIDQADVKAIATVFIAALASAISLFVFVWIPAHVTFVRVAASMLPEEDESIVSFDRSFNGRVVPGEGQIGMKDAWKTFSWEQRRRFMGVVVKVLAMEIVVTLTFFLAILPTEFMIFSPNFKAVVTQNMNMKF